MMMQIVRAFPSLHGILTTGVLPNRHGANRNYKQINRFWRERGFKIKTSECDVGVRKWFKDNTPDGVTMNSIYKGDTEINLQPNWFPTWKLLVNEDDGGAWRRSAPVQKLIKYCRKLRKETHGH